VIPTITGGASFGAAFLAASAVTEADIDEWNPPADIRRPEPERTAEYDELYALYLALYPATRTISHALAVRQARPGPQPAHQ